MERRAYQLTESDLRRAEKKAEQGIADIARADAALQAAEGKARRKASLRKRDATALALQGEPEWQRGRGQGISDKLGGLSYSGERLSAAYNAGYYEGYNFSRGELHDYLTANPNFAGLL